MSYVFRHRVRQQLTETNDINGTSTPTHNTLDHHKLEVMAHSVKQNINTNATTLRQRNTPSDTTRILNNTNTQWKTLSPFYSLSFVFLIRDIPLYILNHKLAQVMFPFKQTSFSCKCTLLLQTKPFCLKENRLFSFNHIFSSFSKIYICIGIGGGL